jgi:hypothetical protein
MNIKALVISNAAKLILGGQLWVDVRHLVSSINGDTKLAGSEKRAAVFADLRAIWGDVSTVLLNCAIEIATLWIRTLG